MMKFKMTLFAGIFCVLFSAQQGKVGINTDNPSAALDVVSKGNTNTTKALKISNSSTTEMVTVRDNGQVGINQATPATDALLELNATNKALLLTRVTNATDVATPVNGMLVYDITKNCVRGYENSAWSDCLSAGGGGGSSISGLGLNPSELNIKQLSFVDNSGEAYYEAWAVTTDNKLYAWGRNYYGDIVSGIPSNPLWISANYNGSILAPTHINHTSFDGIVEKVSTQGHATAVLTTTGLVYAHGSTTYPGWTGSDKFYPVIPTYNTGNYNLFPQSPNGVGWKDIGISCHRFYLIDRNGKAYWTGASATYNSNTAVTSLQPILHPNGKNFEKVIPIEIGWTVYLIDEDGKLWASGFNDTGQLGNGSTTNRDINQLAQVQFSPATSLKVVDVIYAKSRIAAAILEDGSAYVWANTTKLNNVLSAANAVATKTTAVPLPLPAGATKFIKIGFAVNDILALTDNGMFKINTGTNWTSLPGTKGFVNMFEENQGYYWFDSSNRVLGSHFLLDANNKLWVYGAADFGLFTATEDYLLRCDKIYNYRIHAYLPKRILNGNVLSSPDNNCGDPGPIVPKAE